MIRCAPATVSRTLWAILAAMLVTAAPAAYPATSPATRPAPAADAGVVLAPEGGRLDALDERGDVIGSCPLTHTDVDVQISGHFSRVSVTQRYQNPSDRKIEAVYTFPLSHRAAVDRMTMTVGDRVVQGEVKRRAQARQIYEAARRQGHVTSLLEQERPNIFTQSIANIEPGAEVVIEISYVEPLVASDGVYGFTFPMVVGPRYTPGQRVSPGDALPDDVIPLHGPVLPAGARVHGERGLDAAWLRRHATVIDARSPIVQAERRQREDPRWTFSVERPGGGREPGVIFGDGVGRVGRQWVYFPPRVLPAPGEPFAADTNQVPDASRVTPMPVRPEQRAGHDVALRVRIDTGGPGITQLDSSSHEIVRDDAPSDRADGLPRRTAIALKTGATIPNRDFRLAWRLSSDRIEEATLTHTGNYGDGRGGFFSLILQPPARVADAEARPRELIFVLDSSGSMSGAGLADRSAIDAARDIIRAALDTMRPDDRFNVISFNNTVDVLWDAPRAGNRGNRDEARRYVDARQGGGGTEMRAAVLRALRDRRDDDDDGRMRIVVFLTDGLVSNDAAILDAIREHAHATRVFTIGMSHAPNRHLLDEMARVGRGAADYALPADDVEPIVERFVGRIATPVLTDIELSFAGVEVTDVLPSRGQMPDLFDVQPLVIHGRYREPGRGTLTITGRTGAGRYERSIDVTLPEVQPGHDTIATLWARERVGELMRDGGGERMTDPDRIARIVRLGERFQLVTHHTSFVAVERQRVTIAGQPMLVRVPIEFPRGMSWQGVFGDRREGEQLGDEVTAGDAVQWFAAEPARREMVVRQRAAQGVPAADHLSMAQQPVMRELRESVAVRAAGTGGGGRGRLDMVADGDDAVSVAGLAHMFNRPSGEVAQPVGELAGGVSLVAVMLRGVDRDDTTGRLRVLLGDGADANEDKPVPIGRVIALNGQAGLILVLPESLAAAVRPSAEALARDGVTAAERDAAIAGLFDALERELPDIRREMELRRRLEASLHEQLGEAGPNRREAVRVTVLLDDVAPATLDTLRDAGFVHEATAPAASFVVGRINLDRLEAMALIDAVRRIESVR